MISRAAFAIFLAAFVTLIALANLGAVPHLFHLAAQIPGGDKFMHLLLTGTLALLLNLKLNRHTTGPIMTGSLCVLILMTLEESSQIFLPHRTADLADALANTAGVLCAEGLTRMLPSRRPDLA